MFSRILLYVSQFSIYDSNIVIEMERKIAEITVESERRLNQAIICFTLHVLVIFSLIYLMFFSYLLNFLRTFLHS